MLCLLACRRRIFPGHDGVRAASKLTTSYKYCENLVKKQDYENYLSSLLLPRPVRPAVIAIRAYNVSLATVRENVSDTNIGRMRFAFWRENIEQIYKTGSAPEQPVLALLCAAIKHFKLPKQWVVQMITCRESRLADNPFASLNEAEQYYDQAFSAPLFLTLQCMGVQDMNADHAASHLGRAQGLATLVRGVPYFAAQHKVLLPVELCLHHGVTQESIVRREVQQPLRDVIYDIAGQAHIHLEKAQKMHSQLPKNALPVLLPAVPCRMYLSTLQQRNFDPFDPVCARQPALLALKMAWNKFRGTF